MNDDYDTLNGHNFVKYGPIFKSFTFLESSFSALSNIYLNSISKFDPSDWFCGAASQLGIGGSIWAALP